MIYGASGYTGGLISKQAKDTGLDIVLAGRTPGSLQKMATLLDAPYRLFDLHDPRLIDSSLQGVGVLLNCAGPFRNTAEHLIEACIRNGVHYLDISAELETYAAAENRDIEAKAAGIMLLPGCANILGCLAGWALDSAKDVQGVELALHVSGPMSKGSINTAEESTATECLRTHEGNIECQDAASTVPFDFADGRGQVECFPITLPEIITTFKFLGVPNVRTYFNASTSPAPDGGPGLQGAGPTAEERESSPYHAVIVVTATDQGVKRTVLHTVNGYTFVSLVSVEAVRLITAGKFGPGFQASASAFGADFARSFAVIALP